MDMLAPGFARKEILGHYHNKKLRTPILNLRVHIV